MSPSQRVWACRRPPSLRIHSLLEVAVQDLYLFREPDGRAAPSCQSRVLPLLLRVTTGSETYFPSQLGRPQICQLLLHIPSGLLLRYTARHSRVRRCCPTVQSRLQEKGFV